MGSSDHLRTLGSKVPKGAVVKIRVPFWVLTAPSIEGTHKGTVILITTPIQGSM